MVRLSHLFPGPSQKPFLELLYPQSYDLISLLRRQGSQVQGLWGISTLSSDAAEAPGHGEDTRRTDLEMWVGTTAQTTKAQRGRSGKREARMGMKGGDRGAGPQPAELGVQRDPKDSIQGQSREQSTKNSHRDHLRGLAKAWGLGTGQ